MYGSGDVLYAAGFDAGTLTLTTVAVPVVEGLNTKLTGAVNFTVSDGGALLYVPGTRAALAAQRSLVWVNETGDEEDVALASRDYSGPRVSPDGRRVAVRVREAQEAESDIWVLDLERQASNRITFDASVSGGIAWSPDGEWIAYGTRAGLFRKRADGTGVAEALQENQVPDTLGFVPDGSGLVFSEQDRAGDLFQLAIEDEGVGSPTPLITTGIEAGRAPWERNPSISPDGRWLTYDSDETGRREVWVRPFPNVDDGRWQVTTNGGIAPAWSPDGRELFYHELRDARFSPEVLGDNLMAVSVGGDSAFTFENPRVVVSASYQAPSLRNYDVAPDGRFLMVKRGDMGIPLSPRLFVVLNWHEELKRLVPVD